MSGPDLRRLADTWAERPSFLSLYLDLRQGVDQRFFQKRKREMERALRPDPEERELFLRAAGKAEAFLAGPLAGLRGLALFCGPDPDQFETHEAPPEVGNLMVFDSSPYIKPLAGLASEWDETVVVLLDHSHARIFTVSLHKVHHEDLVAEEIVRKHRSGGMSQLRFQRLHEGFAARYFKEVAEHLAREVASARREGRLRGIVIEGPKEVKPRFEKHLTPELEKLVMGRADEPADAPGPEAVRKADEFVSADIRKEREGLLQKLRSGVLSSGLVAYGLEEVRAAVEQGRADLVLLEPGLARRGWRCEHCRAFGPGDAPACTSCGKATVSVDEVEELTELAMDRGTRVEFAPAGGLLSDLGGIGALLRF